MKKLNFFEQADAPQARPPSRHNKHQAKVCNLATKEIEITTPDGAVFRIKIGSKVLYVKDKSGSLPSIVENIDVNFRIGEQPDVDIRKPDGNIVNTTIKNLLPYHPEESSSENPEAGAPETPFWRPNATQLDSEDEWMIVDSEPETPVVKLNRKPPSALAPSLSDHHEEEMQPPPVPELRLPDFAIGARASLTAPLQPDPWAEFSTPTFQTEPLPTPVTIPLQNPLILPFTDCATTLEGGTSLWGPRRGSAPDPAREEEFGGRDIVLDDLPNAQIDPDSTPDLSTPEFSPIYHQRSIPAMRPLSQPRDVPRAVRDFRNVPSAARVYAHLSRPPRCVQFAQNPFSSPRARTSWQAEGDERPLTSVFPMSRRRSHTPPPAFGFGGAFGVGGGLFDLF